MSLFSPFSSKNCIHSIISVYGSSGRSVSEASLIGISSFFFTSALLLSRWVVFRHFRASIIFTLTEYKSKKNAKRLYLAHSISILLQRRRLFMRLKCAFYARLFFLFSEPNKGAVRLFGCSMGRLGVWCLVGLAHEYYACK